MSSCILNPVTSITHPSIIRLGYSTRLGEAGQKMGVVGCEKIREANGDDGPGVMTARSGSKLSIL